MSRNLHPEEEKLVGRWQEEGAITYVLDPITGEIVDTTNVGAFYEFRDDHTYINDNDQWIFDASGTWHFDSTYEDLYIFSNDLQKNSPEIDLWQIVELTSTDMNIEHFHRFEGQNDTTTFLLFRKFVKIE